MKTLLDRFGRENMQACQSLDVGFVLQFKHRLHNRVQIDRERSGSGLCALGFLPKRLGVGG